MAPENYEEIKLFLDMMDAGWKIPEWLKNEEWGRLQLVALKIANLKRLPMMQLNPDKKTGMHGLPMKGYAISTPFSPDTTTVSVELLFLCMR